MITPVKIPTPVSLSENPVLISLKTDNDILNQGTRAKIILYFGSVIYTGTGYQFSLTFGGNTYTFTMAETPDYSGLQFPRAATNDNNFTWMAKIRDAIMANFYVSENYDATYTYNEVILTAKQPGTAYNISGANISVSGMSLIPSVATDQQARNFFKLFLQVLMDNTVIGEDILPVNANHIAEFDISEYLKGHVSGIFEFPESATTLMFKRSECCKDYSIRYCEYYADNDTPSMRRMTAKGPYKAITGGVSAEMLSAYNKNNTNWWSQQCATRKFLSWHPGSKVTAPYDIQKLYYLVHSILPGNHSGNINLFVVLRYTVSGVQYTAIYDKGNIQASIGDVIEICCGYSRMALDADASALPAGALVSSYDVFLRDINGLLISEIKRFILDFEHYEFYRQFIFRNSYGMFETIRFTGIKESNTDYINSVNDYVRTHEITERHPDMKKFASTETAKHVINTGYITAEELDWTRELFLSKEVYEIQENNLYPVIITGESALVSRDDNTLHNQVVEYRYACNEYHYGKGKIATIASGGQVVIQPINSNTSVNVVPHVVVHEPPAVALSTPVIDQVPINYNI